ncbi:MAG TPA: ring-opening amidohydrolase [Burkholderiales bacterium]|jgi:cyanuric acid amidohydrolase|nr:ring-opening amidohydrolase [Burkholderiales bacterium]
MKVAVLPFDMSSPGDGAGLRRALRRLALDEVLQLAVVAKIEGTATLNDVSRELAAERIGAELRRAGGHALLRRSLRLLSAGCEGVITPGGWVIASLRARGGAAFGLALGHARSAPVAMRDRATPRHIRTAAGAVRAAMRRAGLDRKSVELVLIKSPILLAGAGRHAGSTAASRGAAALGGALALGELRGSDIDESSLCADWTLHSSRTMAFSGTETDCCEALVMGNRRGGDSRLRVERAVLADILDAAPLAALASEARAVFYKAGIGRFGTVRGARTTVLTSELAADKQLRAAASGVVGATLGTTRSFISGGAEHQGPPGTCLAAVIRAADY